MACRPRSRPESSCAPSTTWTVRSSGSAAPRCRCPTTSSSKSWRSPPPTTSSAKPSRWWARGRAEMSEVNMPKLSDTMEEGTVIEWKKKSGDPVKKGDVLAEVESDKASFELEADADGVLSIVIDAGKAMPVGAVIANIGKAGEKPAKPAAEAEPAPEPKAEAQPKADAKPKSEAEPKA